MIVLALLAGGLLFLLWASLAASLLHFRGRRHEPGPPLRMTLIKPIRGADAGLREKLESVARSDPAGSLQVIIAIESAADPAYPVARGFAEAHSDRDILVLLTGPSGARMGKIHNMIEALPKAKHPYILFSDADIRTTPGLIAETSDAFRRGIEAVFALPYHAAAPGLGGWAYMVAFNHCFCVPAALSLYLGPFRFAAGAWMGYTRELLERIGGLEQFSQDVADDFAISDKAFRAGARKWLIRELCWVEEAPGTLRETFEHLVKWAAIVRWSLPGLYFLMPAANLGALALAYWALDGRWGGILLFAALASRGLVGLIQDALVGGFRMEWWGYLLLAFADWGSFAFWLAGLKSRILWRGKTYRLRSGGKVEVLTDSGPRA